VYGLVVFELYGLVLVVVAFVVFVLYGLVLVVVAFVVVCGRG
jgi:hypothetical protein